MRQINIENVVEAENGKQALSNQAQITMTSFTPQVFTDVIKSGKIAVIHRKTLIEDFLTVSHPLRGEGMRLKVRLEHGDQNAFILRGKQVPAIC